MKTFEQLKEQITPEIIKKMCELAAGFEFVQDKAWHGGYYVTTKPQIEYSWSLGSLDSDEIILSLLLYRAVEGWNNKNESSWDRIIIESKYKRVYVPGRTKFNFSDYQPSHLTPCEMAILDCFIKILKED